MDKSDRISPKGDKFEYIISNVSEGTFNIPSIDNGITNRPERFGQGNATSTPKPLMVGNFQLPTSTKKQLFLFGEIHSAKGFENDNM